MDRRHNAIRDAVAKWLEEQGWQAIDTEQVVPQWARRKADGSIEEAVLDVAFRAGPDRIFVDVTVTDPQSTDPERARRRAQRDGAAAAEAEGTKRLRYPHPEMTPVAVETLGRMGSEARAFAQRWATRDPDKRPAAIAAFYRRLGTVLLTHNGDLLRAAVAP